MVLSCIAGAASIVAALASSTGKVSNAIAAVCLSVTGENLFT